MLPDLDLATIAFELFASVMGDGDAFGPALTADDIRGLLS
jgi:hypothetical protein